MTPPGSTAYYETYMNLVFEVDYRASSAISLFVDDFAFCLRGRSLPSVIRRLQLCVNSVNKWVQENGFRFSVSKTECVHFTNQRGVFMEPDIKVDGTSIKVADEAKFLGLVFDRRLTFRAHVKYLKTVCDKALNVLRVVTSHRLGCRQSSPLASLSCASTFEARLRLYGIWLCE